MEKLNLEEIKQSNTKKLAKEIEYFEEIPSTHLYAKNIALNEKQDGKFIFAEAQTAGIGTKGRSWYTGKGKNIAMTLILKPKCNIEQLSGLTVAIAECMKQTIFELYGYKLVIKEPNDLLLNNKKICGILTEINTMGEDINYLLISLGMNINEENFSDETKNLATSLKKEYGVDFSREKIIARFLEKLERIYFRYSSLLKLLLIK